MNAQEQTGRLDQVPYGDYSQCGKTLKQCVQELWLMGYSLAAIGTELGLTKRGRDKMKRILQKEMVK